VAACYAPEVVPEIQSPLEGVHVCIEDGGPHSCDPSPREAQFLTPANLTAGQASPPGACQSGRQETLPSHINAPASMRKSLCKSGLQPING
jgi:hypothetical protein